MALLTELDPSQYVAIALFPHPAPGPPWALPIEANPRINMVAEARMVVGFILSRV
jgi:hypothetical protein